MTLKARLGGKGDHLNVLDERFYLKWISTKPYGGNCCCLIGLVHV